MRDDPRVELYNGIPHLCWHGDYVPLQHLGAALGEMVLERDAEIERLRGALAACRKYALAQLSDDPTDGLAIVIRTITAQAAGGDDEV